MRSVLVSLLLALSFSVSAKTPHHAYEYKEPDVINNVVNKYYENSSRGVASAMAMTQCRIDRSTYKAQGCFTGAIFDSEASFSFGGGIRTNADGDLFTYGVSIENSDIGYAAGYSWKY